MVKKCNISNLVWEEKYEKGKKSLFILLSFMQVILKVKRLQ